LNEKKQDNRIETQNKANELIKMTMKHNQLNRIEEQAIQPIEIEYKVRKWKMEDEKR